MPIPTPAMGLTFVRHKIERARRSNERFSVGGEAYPYFLHPYNHTWLNERIVEVALADRLLQGRDPADVLEVGNVMAYYGHRGHRVVDLYEQNPGVENVDVLDFHPGERYGLILAISTIEHIGYDEDVLEEGKPGRAVEHLASLLAPGGRLFVTFALGYNAFLDRDLRAGKVDLGEVHYLKRVDARNHWREVPAAEVRHARYGLPYEKGNGVVVATRHAPAGA